MQTKQIEVAYRFALNYLKSKSPIDTGNLRYNAIKYRIEGDRFIIYVDEKIAPYMVFTNEPWINRRGTNPNEGWWDYTIEEVLRLMAIFLKGELKKV